MALQTRCSLFDRIMSKCLQRNLNTSSGSISVASDNALRCQDWSWVSALGMSTVSTKYRRIWLLVLSKDETEAVTVVTLHILPIAALGTHSIGSVREEERAIS